MAQFSVHLYATGDLADELAAYQAKASELCSTQVCLPHCTLAENFEGSASVNDYVRHLDSAIIAASQQDGVIADVVEVRYCENQHLLEIASPWIEGIMVQFQTGLLDLQTPISLRQPLTLTLAVPKGAAHEALLPVSQSLDWSARAGWDLKLCQKQGDGWSIEAAWPIQQP